MLDYPEDAFDHVMAVNARGVYLGMKLCVPELLKTNGSVVNIASVSGIGGTPWVFGYCASKHAVVGMTRTAASELANRGVRVNAVCPAPIATDMIDELARTRSPDDPDAFARAFQERLPMGRYGEPAEVANVVAFLAAQTQASSRAQSSRSTAVSASADTVDGGTTRRIDLGSVTLEVDLLGEGRRSCSSTASPKAAAPSPQSRIG
jgi:NAD(P)-dependent dehydrogenase (short-subunit alcohol dehydrogenase family)